MTSWGTRYLHATPWRSVRASREEKTRELPGDNFIPQAIDTLTHGVTMQCAPRDVWPWLVQMGAGARAGWYSYDWLDNGRQPSAARVVPELQHPAVGSVFPALPGKSDAFTLLAIERERLLILGYVKPDGTTEVTWAFVLNEAAPGVTRLLVRVRGGPGYRFHGLPLALTRLSVRIVHFIMQRKQLIEIARRAEHTGLVGRVGPKSSAFRTREGEAAFRAAYDATLKLWPVPFEEIDVPTRFGSTHVVVSGPKSGPPLVLLHGFMSTLTAWAPNIADLSERYRVYAVDVMGQPGKSIPDEPIRTTSDYVEWLNATVDGLHLDRFFLCGMSYGGWVALTYASAMQERVRSLVLLSPGGLLPMSRQFATRAMLMATFPSRFAVNSFMRWLGFSDAPGENDARPVFELIYLGMKHFRVPIETLQALPPALTDEELRGLRVPVLLLFGDRERIYDPAAALERAGRLVPDFRGELIPDCSHDMVLSRQWRVDSRVLEFLDGQVGLAGQVGQVERLGQVGLAGRAA